jgi:glycosyltransferase involved in cell wall biosynthesis
MGNSIPICYHIPMLDKKLRIQFILPGAGISGGVKVVYEYANRLQARGHTVTIVYPGTMKPKTDSPLWAVEARLRQGKYFYQRLIGYTEASWFPLNVPLVRVPSLEARYISAADVVIATANETADWVAQLPARCGSKFYFIQGFEDWARPAKEVIATYSLPMRHIVISSFLRDLVERHTERPVAATILNGVDTTIFFNAAKKLNQPRRLLMLSHHDENKGVSDGFEALQSVRKIFPEVTLTMFGAKTARPDMPKDTFFVQAPTSSKLRELYSTSDIFISPSRNEGFSLTPMEAMACGTAVVTTRVGAVPDYAIAGKTAIVVPAGNPDELAAGIISLLSNEDLLLSVSQEGHDYVQKFTWEKSADQFEETLLAT